VEVSCGKELSPEELAERVTLALDLVARLGETLLASHWSEADLETLASGVDASAKVLATKGYVALRQLQWTTARLPGLVVNDRFRRCIEENVARSLRQACYRKQVVEGILASWPEDPWQRTPLEWAALRRLLPEVGKAEIRNRTRQVAAFVNEHHRLPADLIELEPQVRLGRVLLLAAADRQLVRLARAGEDEVVVTVLLPTTAAPSSYREWSWVSIHSVLPPTVPAEAELTTPTLRVVEGRVRLDLPFEERAPRAAIAGHTLALGVDWGIKKFLTASVGRLMDGRVISDGRPLIFDPSGVSVRLGRLRHLRESLAAKIAHLEKLAQGRPAGHAQRTMLETKLEVLEREREAVCARTRQLGRSLAWAGARWLVDQALAHQASVVYIEDLATLEGRGMSSSANARISSTIRGALFEGLRHLAARAGVAVVLVPARGTSAFCPHCGRPLRHVKAPDRLRSGWSWAVCPHCHLSSDRDHAAAERILARGLLSQDAVTRDRSGRAAVESHTDGPVARARRRKRRRERPHGNGRAHTRHPKKRSTRRASATPAEPPVPRRRGVPTIATQVASQRPVGRVPQGGSAVQAPTAFSSGRQRLAHRPRHAALGRGFHHRVYASPVLPRGNWGPRPVSTPLLRIA
jgi:hypothetical protein